MLSDKEVRKIASIYTLVSIIYSFLIMALCVLLFFLRNKSFPLVAFSVVPFSFGSLVFFEPKRGGLSNNKVLTKIQSFFLIIFIVLFFIIGRFYSNLLDLFFSLVIVSIFLLFSFIDQYLFLKESKKNFRCSKKKIILSFSMVVIFSIIFLIVTFCRR